MSELIDRLTQMLELRDRRELVLRTQSLALAVAGIDERFSTVLFEESVRNLGFSHAKMIVLSLAETGHIGAFLGSPGLLVRCGDDASAYIRTPSGHSKLIGAWGGAVGDRGSGPWIGRKALIAATRVLDGNAEREEIDFVSSLVSATRLARPIDLLEEVNVQRYWNGDLGARRYLSSLGSRTIELADKGDPHAQSLVERSIAQIIDMLKSSMKSLLAGDGPIPACFRGSILENHSYFCRSLAHQLVREFPSLSLFSTGCTGGFSAIIGAGLVSLGWRTEVVSNEQAHTLARLATNGQELSFNRKECCLVRCPLIPHTTIPS